MSKIAENFILTTIFLSLNFVVIFTQALSQNKSSEVGQMQLNEFVGEYIYSNGFVGATYKIKDDGKFEYRSFSDCCDPVWREFGDYRVNEHQIHFTISKKTLNQFDMLDQKQATNAYRELYNYKGDEIRANEIETEYNLQIIKWGERVYLVEPERLQFFVASINFGIEPRRDLLSKFILTSYFYLRRGDEKLSVVGKKPTIPEPFISFLQDSPISATVAKIESQKNDKIFILDKGSVDGLKVGMAFVGTTSNPDVSNLAWVISVDKDTSKATSGADYQIGSMLTTKKRLNSEFLR